jgi:hypothetical protein
LYENWMVSYSNDRFIYLTDKVDESEKNTGPLGVIPITVLKIRV